ncbi:MAG: hypothetical protein AAFP19_26460, partial [Bacteroidota bacterium]
MMRVLYSFLIILSGNLSICSQNLIPNPGFDKLVQCPDAYSQIDFTAYWTSASNGTPDLYHACANAIGLQVPNAGIHPDSYQEAKSGMGYVGIYVYSNIQNGSGNSEYLQSPLTETLKAGHTYFISFEVSPDLSANNYWRYTDGIGLAFSDSFFYQNLTGQQAIALEVVVNNPLGFIQDTNTWTRISDCYTANGTEQFAIIGNFQSTEAT